MILYDKVSKYIAFLEGHLPIKTYSQKKQEFHSWVVREEKHLNNIQVTKHNTRHREKVRMQRQIDELTRELLELKLYKLNNELAKLEPPEPPAIHKILDNWEDIPMPETPEDNETE